MKLEIELTEMSTTEVLVRLPGTQPFIVWRAGEADVFMLNQILRDLLEHQEMVTP